MTTRSSDFEHINYKRRANDRVAPYIRKHLSAAAYKNFTKCGFRLDMLEDESGEHRKLLRGFFCGQRFCSGCAWRQATRDAQMITAIMQDFQGRGYVPVFITLTIPNVPGDGLRRALRDISDGIKCLRSRKDMKVLLADCIRRVEVTFNAKRRDFHPHAHILAFVRSGYFHGRHYVSHERLMTAWREVMGDDTICQVRIQRVKDKSVTEGAAADLVDDPGALDQDKGQGSAVLEMAKYISKASDYAEHGESVFDTFYEALAHYRFLEFFGACRDLQRQYKAGKLALSVPEDEIQYLYWAVYCWQRLTDGASPSEHEYAYVLNGRKLLDEDGDGVDLEIIRGLQERDAERVRRARELDRGGVNRETLHNAMAAYQERERDRAQQRERVAIAERMRELLEKDDTFEQMCMVM